MISGTQEELCVVAFEEATGLYNIAEDLTWADLEVALPDLLANRFSIRNAKAQESTIKKLKRGRKYDPYGVACALGAALNAGANSIRYVEKVLTPDKPKSNLKFNPNAREGEEDTSERVSRGPSNEGEGDQESASSPLPNYCFLNRSLRNHTFLGHCPCWVKLMWVNFLMDAAWKDHDHQYKGKTIHLKRGQLVTSERDLSREYNVDRRMINYYLDKLSEQLMIQRVTLYTKPGDDTLQILENDVPPHVPHNVPGYVPGGTLVTLTNYSRFQPNFVTTVPPYVPPRVPPVVPTSIEEGTLKKDFKECDGELESSKRLLPKNLFEIWNQECGDLPKVESYRSRGTLEKVEGLADHFNSYRDPMASYREFVHKCREVHPSHHHLMSPTFFANEEHLNQLLRGMYHRQWNSGDSNVRRKDRLRDKGSPEQFADKKFSIEPPDRM